MTDNLQKLLQRKSPFPDSVSQASAQLTRLKQQNDSLQHNCDIELDGQLIKQISKKDTINKIRVSIQDIEKQAKGFDQKKQVKKLKQFYIKEVERNKSIMNTLIKKSFGSFGEPEDENREDLERQMAENFPEYSENLQTSDSMNSTQIGNIQEDRQFFYQTEHQHQILHERQIDLNQIEHDAHNINKIMGQLAMKVNEQDQHLDIITDAVIKTKTNVEAANKELQVANQYSQEGKKKYLYFALFVFILTSLLVGSLFYFEIIQV